MKRGKVYFNLAPMGQYVLFGSPNWNWSISYLSFNFNAKQRVCPFRYSWVFCVWHKVPLNVKGIPKTNIFTRATIVSEFCTNTKDWLFKTMNSTIVNNTDSNP